MMFDENPNDPHPQPKRAVIYARVSTDAQEKSNQIPECKGFISLRGWKLTGMYLETETAWREGHQHELSRMYNDAYKGKFDVIVVWALDRLSREGIYAMFELMHKFESLNVRIFSIQESWTWTHTTGETHLLLAITAFIAEFESKRRSERTKAGLRETLRKGVTREGKPFKQMGRPPGSKDRNKRKRRRK